MAQRPLILATCDDGVESPGLRAAVRAMIGIGDVIVSAPCDQQSGSGRSLPTSHDGAIHAIDFDVDGHRVPAFALHASPAQAVAYALLELVPRRPALCVSGINFGANIGTSIGTSGTVGAAMEAADEGITALAVSLETDKKHHYQHSDDVDFSAAEHFTRLFAVKLLSTALPHDVDALKVDVPSNATSDTPWRPTRVSRQRYYTSKPSGRRYLGESRRLGYSMEIDPVTLEPDSDTYALLIDREVSVTPLSLDPTSRVARQKLDTLLR